MMMYPGQDTNSSIPIQMSMPTPAKEGDKNNPQQPFIYMMPVCIFDPSKMPKDMKMPNMENMPNMPFPFFPYPMSFPQNQDNK